MEPLNKGQLGTRHIVPCSEVGLSWRSTNLFTSNAIVHVVAGSYTMKNWALISTTNNRTIIIISDTSSNG